MAVRVTIPQGSVPGFKVLADLSEESFSAVLGAVKTIPVGALPTSYRKTFRVPNIPTGDMDALGRMVFSFGSLMSQYDNKLVVTPADLLDSYLEQTKQSLDDTAKGILRDRLGKVLSASINLSVTYKATALLNANIVLQDLKIYSDVRFVFEDEELTRLGEYSVLFHNLSIDYGHGDETKNLSITVDGEQLLELRKTIDRAIKKEELMRMEPALRTVKFISSEDA